MTTFDTIAMKREHKFRAKSLDDELIYFELHESNQSGDSEVFYVNDIPCESGTEQEYTGLKDKNGKEIYEGDLFYIDYELITIEIPSFYYLLESEMSLPDRSDQIKIIGNVYENSELIES